MAAEIAYSRLEQWSGQAINIVVLGRRLSGKSSFINSIRGLTADDVGGAETGIRNNPQDTRCYTHPGSTNVKFWEIKAYTSDDPALYLDREIPVGVNVDIYILLSVGCFEGKDKRLANEMKRRNYNLVFIRTKIDGDITGAYRSNPNTFIASQIVGEVKSQCSRVLGVDHTAVPVFLVCNYKTNNADFPALLCHLVDKLPEDKQDHLLYCMDGLVSGLADKKHRYLKSRVGDVALHCTAHQRCARKECIIQVDMDMLADEAWFFFEQLGLADVSVTKLEQNLNLALNLLTRPQLTPEFLQYHFLLSVGNSARTTDEMGENSNSPLRVPPPAESPSIDSYKAAYQFLSNILEMFKEGNNELLQKAERLSNQQPPFI